jgi:O-antigen ligase
VFGLALIAIMDPAARVALRRIAIGALVLVLIGGVATLQSLPGITRLSGSGGAVQSDITREAIYGRVIAEIEQRPFVGHGFEYLRGSNNIYLQVLHSGGIFGFAALLTLVIGLIVTGWRVARRTQRPLVRAFLASSLTWLLVDGMFEPAIFDRYLYIPIGLLLACWAVARVEKPARNAEPSRLGLLAIASPRSS